MTAEATRFAIPEFELVEELGRGATTAVYRALRAGEQYAVKVRELSGPEDPARIAFRREAAILAALRHPCLGKVYEVGDDGRVAYLVMELIGGRTLAQLIDSHGPLSEQQATAIVSDVASALDAAHRVGLVHRDVSPRNVVIREDGNAVLIDFGLATPTGTRQPEDSVVGTVLYSAPEQTGMVRRPVDRRSDLYSLGAVLFECLAGRPPFRSADAGEVVRLHAVAPAPDLSELRGDASPQICRIVAKLLAKDPDDRYPDAQRLLSDLTALRRGTLGTASPLAQLSGEERPAAEDPLIGRDTEMGVLVELLSETRSGRCGAAVLLESEPGGGRTRLAAELVRVARSGGATVVEAQLTTDHLAPIGPLAEAIGRCLGDLEIRAPAELDRLRSQLRLFDPSTASSLVGLSPELDRYLAPTRADDGAPAWHEFAVVEAAHLLIALASASAAGMVLVLDNAHLADDATYRVLAYLAPELERIPLLLVVTSRNDPASGASLARLRDQLGEAMRRRIELAPLSDDDIAQILRRQLGGDTLDAGLASEIILRANGNPAAAIEYLRSALDAGVLRPSWGTFSVDGEVLAGLDLPGDVLGLALRRLETLRPATRWLLTEAAVIGTRFSLDLLARVTRWPLGDVHVALFEAARARVAEPAGADRYRFLHEGTRERLLATLDPPSARRSHQLLAEALEEGGDGRPDAIYEIARHYALGEVDSSPLKAFQANYRAARLALAARADDEALGFFAAADTIARDHSLPLGGAFHADYASAMARTGDAAGALGRYEVALGLEQDGPERARVHEAVARLRFALGDGEQCLDHARMGLRSLGRPLPSNRLALWLSSLAAGAAAFAMLLTRIGFGRASMPAREKLRLQCRMLELAGYASQQEHRWGTEIAVAIRSTLPANRLGHSREYVAVYSGIGSLLAQTRLNGPARLMARHVRRVAEATGDPYAKAHAKLLEGMSLEYQGDSIRSEELLAETLRQDLRWLSTGEMVTGVVQLCHGLALRGRVLEEISWLDEALWHVRPEAAGGGEQEIRSFDFVGISLAGFLDQPSAGLDRIRRVEEYLASVKPSRMMLASYQLALASFHFGLNELGEPFDKAVESFRAKRLPPWNCPYTFSSFWAVQAYGRVAQLLAAEGADRRSRRRLARRAVAELRIAARTPVLRAYHLTAKTGYLVATGRHRRALRVAARAEQLLVGQDAPGVEVALAMARARALDGAGYEQEAERTAITASRLAEDLGLTAYTRWIEPRSTATLTSTRRYPTQTTSLAHLARSGAGHLFDAREHAGAARVLALAAPTGGPGAGPLRGATRAARQLEALLQVGAAAARVLDPEELIRLALDETVRILNAERALLFLCDGETGAVRPHLGRDASGNDLVELTGYSTTVVDKVAATREPMVLTGTEQGAALGSDSAVTHGLRSILVAPLVMEERLLGAVYLDSRLAKGIFTHDDVEILAAITSHVAFALETARLAEMELSVASERRQREVAELLRDSMHTLGQSLEPRGVLDAMLRMAMEALSADAGATLLAEGERLEVVAAAGADVGLPPEGYDIARSDQPEIAEALRSRSPISVASVISERNSPLFGLLGRAGSFVIAPLVVRDAAVGALVVVARRPSAFGDTQTKIVAALAGQGVVAYENAQLFSRVQTLAQRDELSGIANRRHFFELARQAFAEARLAGTALSAMMLDIDHFKDVNDRFGHASGDDVIRAVAQRISGVIGSGDLLGRYGGEEFALVVRGNLQVATDLAERLRYAISESPIPTAAGPVSVTASVGVAQLSDKDQDLGRLLQRTDGALYEAKRAGRDRVARSV
ncbi:MAG TPA: diguanylate cyclase [Acidimicrobiales bacterium]|nr:diguanylate cyclase [Acidimicrobiales bacterium]